MPNRAVPSAMTEDSDRTRVRRTLCRFDSPGWLSEVVMGALEQAAPKTIVDLGSGGGALAAAALARWGSSKLVTVDVDATAADEVRLALASHGGAAHRHLVADLLQSLAGTPAADLSGSVDLVVSNPPYRAARWTPALARILERVGFPAPSAVCGDVPADLVFVAQALDLVRPGGSLGLILPDSLISGMDMRPFRQALVEAHRVARVIQLPRRAFKGTDAQAFVVIMEHGGSGPLVRLDRITANGSWLPPVEIEAAQAVSRMDYGHYAGLRSVGHPGLVPLRDLGVEVRRGRLSSSALRTESRPTFHTTGFRAEPRAGIMLPPSTGSEDESQIWALEGDVLLARVDRCLERKVALVLQGAALLSDCVLRVRCPPEQRERILTGLTSSDGRAQLAARARGTGPRNISVASLLSVRV